MASKFRSNVNRYSTLDTTKEQIRLLAFTEDGISLETHDIASCPRYIALSYSWGEEDPSTDCKIVVNGNAFQVRRNLYQALKALKNRVTRPERRDKLVPARLNLVQSIKPRTAYVWADAMCINQENVNERNHQVQMMSKIYSQATSVWVWLGEQCRNALEILQQEKWDTNALDPFFHADYWLRLWTVQEFELAKEIVFMAGDVAIGLKAAVQRLEYMSIVPKGRILIDRGICATPWEGEEISAKRYRIMERLRTRGQHRNLHLTTLVFRYNTMQCADPRDTIYGLLGLAAQDPNTSMLTADYSLSPQELCEVLKQHDIESWRIAPSLRSAAHASLFEPSHDSGKDSFFTADLSDTSLPTLIECLSCRPLIDAVELARKVEREFRHPDLHSNYEFQTEMLLRDQVRLIRLMLEIRGRAVRNGPAIPQLEQQMLLLIGRILKSTGRILAEAQTIEDISASRIRLKYQRQSEIAQECLSEPLTLDNVPLGTAVDLEDTNKPAAEIREGEYDALWSGCALVSGQAANL